VLSDFKKRWCHEYLTSLRKYHNAVGENHQGFKKGDVVIVHNDTARATWKMAVIEDLIVGRDGLARAATIHTSNGTTSRSSTTFKSMKQIKSPPLNHKERSHLTVNPLINQGTRIIVHRKLQ